MKTIDQKELLELLNSGATISSDFMTDEQQNLLASIAAVNDEAPTSKDVKALKEIMVQMVLQAAPKIAYEFTVQRSSGSGLMTGITATPKKLKRIRH